MVLSNTNDDDNSSKIVNLLDLAASCISSSIVAASQITALARSKNARLKNDGSFVTDADMAAQKVIIDGIRTVSKGVRIVGEENEEEMRSSTITGYEPQLDVMFQLAQKEILIRYHSEDSGNNDNELPLAQQRQQQNKITEEKLTRETLPSSKTTKATATLTNRNNSRMEVYEIDVHRVSIFVDPLDATGSYAKGDYDPVSILVAIVLDNATPCFGVICKPFGYPKQTSILDTSCVAIYGGTLLGDTYTAGGGAVTSIISNSTTTTTEEFSTKEEEEKIQQQKVLPRAVISSSRSKGIVQNFVTHMAEMGMIHPKPLLVSGAGEKSLRIILRTENEGLWFFPKGGTSLWDVAASDALLRATGGKLTDKYGKDMDYSKSRTEAENVDGVIACFDQQLHAECIRLFLEGSWQSR
mmetsp:Transcript_20944/g.24171  ORF Transcript_20944/g.24171 Transcript_20944/m.24171 type:complete len:412 (+) Transcript_20944:130-1365(+)